MERKKSYVRIVYVLILVVCIVSVRNKCEIILLEKVSKGFFCELDGIV